MNLLNHLRLAVQAWLDDLFSEESRLTDAARHDSVEGFFIQAQAALNILNASLAEAIARNKRAETEWAETMAQAQALDTAIDNDLRAGLEGAARTKSVKLAALKEQLERL